MSKKKNKQQRKQQLPVATNKSNAVVQAQSNSQNVPPILPTRVAQSVTIVPPQRSAPSPAITAPSRVVAAPTQVAQVTPSDSTLTGVVVGINYYRDRKPIFCRIKTEDGTVYTAHHTTSTIPEIGKVVQFEYFMHEATKAAKVLQEVGTDPLVAARLAAIKALDTYTLMQPADYFGMSGTDIELPAIIGSTPEGMIILHWEKE